MATLKFSEWDKNIYSLDESLGEDFKNWLSRTFGGGIKKIDGIIDDLLFLEKDYAKEWEKIQHQKSSMKSQIEGGEISEEEEEDFKKRIKDAENKLEVLSRKKTQAIRDLNIKAMKLVQGNSKAHKYWDLKKAEAELKVIENLYNISKSLPDKGLEDNLYSEYKKALDKYTTKEKGVEEITPGIEAPEGEKKSSIDLNVSKLISMSISDFKKEIKKYSKEDLESLRRSLVDQKNLGLNELRALRRQKSKDLDKVSGKEKGRIISKYNPMIYDLGEKIDKIREKINTIND